MPTDIYDEQDTNTKVSKFNSAALIGLRLDSLWKDSHAHSREGKFSKWNADLDRVWCELACDTKEGDDTEKRFNELNQEAGKFGKLSEGGEKSGFKDYSSEQLINKTKQYQALMNKQIFLGRLQNKQGKGTSYMDPEEEDYE